MAVNSDAKNITLMSHHHGTASGNAPKQLVVMLHGYGADGADLIGLAPILDPALPDAAFVAPNAPFPCSMATWGFQWFDINDAANRLEEVRYVDTILQSFLDAQLDAHGVPSEELYVLGFSQGMMVALHSGLRRAVQPRCVIGLSGRLIAPELLAAEVSNRPKILLVHGRQDSVVSEESFHDAKDSLAGAGLDVEAHLLAELAHEINEECVSLVRNFLQKVTVGE